ncbi:MAG TPA: LysR family transcriptional regulator [Paenirhodobacter sp.]
METRDLQTFLAVADTGSITLAAQALGRSQPSVSRDIQMLESELGFALLHRHARRVDLTAEGTAFEEEARRLLAAFSRLAENARSLAAGHARPLRLVATAAVAGGLLPAALAQVDLISEIHLAQTRPTGVTHDLRTGMADLGFASLPIDHQGLEILRLYSAPAAMALRPDDVLAAQDTVQLSDLENRRVVTMLNPRRFQRQTELAFARAGVRHAPALRTNLSVVALRLTAETGAPAIVDPLTAYGMPATDLVIRPLTDAPRFVWGVLATPGRIPTPHETPLLDALNRVAQARIPGLLRHDTADIDMLCAPDP